MLHIKCQYKQKTYINDMNIAKDITKGDIQNVKKTITTLLQ